MKTKKVLYTAPLSQAMNGNERTPNVTHANEISSREKRNQLVARHGPAAKNQRAQKRAQVLGADGA